MLSLFLLLIVFRRYGIDAAPITTPNPHESGPPFQDTLPANSAGRSVLDILWSCLATTVAVTWISVHPNVPFLEEGKSSILRRRLFLMLLALLAPEVMIMWAFKQWRGAVVIKETINKACPSLYRPWTMKHAHFLQMGGFRLICAKNEAYEGNSWYRSHWKALNRDYAYQSRFGNEMWVGVLSYHKFKTLLSSQKLRFPEVDEAEINDRSKGDAPSKGVALLQISWFIVQLIARTRQGLAITEIELTTAALAGLNSVMYLFWWDKPLDVQCPIVVQTKKAEGMLKEREAGAEEAQWVFPMREDDSGTQVSNEDFCLKDYLLSEIARSIRTSWRNFRWTFHSRIIGIWWFFRKSVSVFSRGENEQISVEPESSSEIIDEIPVLENELHHEVKDAVLDDAEEKRLDEKKVVIIQERQTELKQGNAQRTPFSSIHWLWKSALHLPYLIMFLPMHTLLDNRVRLRGFKLQQFGDAKDKIHNKASLSLLFSEQDMKWIMSMMFFSEHTETTPLLCFSALAGAAFGSIHCAAWNFPFPSRVEQIFWRSASLTLVGVCLCIFVGPLVRALTLALFFNAEEDTRAKSFWDVVDDWIRDLIVAKAVHLMLSIIYPLARLSLLVLAILSLRNLPTSALQTVVWADFIPHI